MSSNLEKSFENLVECLGMVSYEICRMVNPVLDPSSFQLDNSSDEAFMASLFASTMLDTNKVDDAIMNAKNAIKEIQKYSKPEENISLRLHQILLKNVNGHTNDVRAANYNALQKMKTCSDVDEYKIREKEYKEVSDRIIEYRGLLRQYAFCIGYYNHKHENKLIPTDVDINVNP
jgi:uncharacterized membrane protein